MTICRWWFTLHRKSNCTRASCSCSGDWKPVWISGFYFNRTPPRQFPLHVQRHFVSLPGSPTQCSKRFSETAGEREPGTWARDGKWNFYLYVSFTNLQLVKCQTLSLFAPKFELYVWSGRVPKDSGYREAEEGTNVCTGMFFPGLRKRPCQSTADSSSPRAGRGHLLLQPLPSQRAGAGPQGSDGSWTAFYHKMLLLLYNLPFSSVLIVPPSILLWMVIDEIFFWGGGG